MQLKSTCKIASSNLLFQSTKRAPIHLLTSIIKLLNIASTHIIIDSLKEERRGKRIKKARMPTHIDIA